jgi:hypothetical protein
MGLISLLSCRYVDGLLCLFVSPGEIILLQVLFSRLGNFDAKKIAVANSTLTTKSLASGD